MLRSSFAPGLSPWPPDLPAVFKRDGEEFHFVNSLLQSWLSQRQQQSSLSM